MAGKLLVQMRYTTVLSEGVDSITEILRCRFVEVPQHWVMANVIPIFKNSR